MQYLTNNVSGHFQPKLRIPDILYLLEGLFQKHMAPPTRSLQRARLNNGFLVAGATL
jgi:hypothetical protein